MCQCVIDQQDMGSNELCWGLMTCQPLWAILCRLLEKGRRDSRGDESEGQGVKRNRNESEETEE